MSSKKWRSTIVVSAFTMLSRILGMVRDVVLVNIFGASGVMDAFLTAFKIPNFFRRLFAEGAFANAFVPVLSEYKTTKSNEEVKRLISRTFGSLTLILSVLTIFVIIAAPWVVMLFAPGFMADINKFNLTTELLQLTFPYLLLMSLVAFAGSVLQSYGSFATTAFAPVLLNITMILAAWYFTDLFPEQPIIALGWAVLVAGALQLLIQLPGLYKKGLLVMPKVDFKDSGVQEIFKLMIPALFGVSVVQINLLLNTVWASFMVTGTVTWLYTAERLTELPLGLIGIAISTVILPTLSAKHAEHDSTKFSETLDWAAKVIVLVGIPASIAMFMLAKPMIATLFQHSSQFSYTDVSMSAIALQGMSISILSFMLIKIFAPGFYARKDTKTPVRIGLISVGVNIVLNVVLIALFKNLAHPDLPVHLALALSSTIASVVNATMLYRALSKAGIFSFKRHWRKLFSQYAFANLAMIICLFFTSGWVVEYIIGQSFGFKIASFLALCAIGALSYFVALFATGFKLKEIR